ncbi:MAG: radical SAM protein [Magnetococcales bacterium]|nr:radical SAM protein [Magnetococcales bacterium]
MGLLYTNMKMFHFKEKLDTLPAASNEIQAPLHVRIKPTNACAHDCWYCAYRKENIQLGKDMEKRGRIPEEKMMEIIEDFSEIGVRAVTFSGGGDPFYYPPLPQSLEKLAEADIRFAALTNGARLDGRLAELFAAYGSWIRISLDGWDRNSYAQYRNISPTEYDRMWNNMAQFKKMNTGCLLGVVIVIDQKNAPHVYDMVRALHDIGVNSVKLSPCIISNDQQKSIDYQSSCADAVTEQIERAINDFHSDQFQISNGYRLQLQTFHKAYHWCPYVQINPVIGADLNVYTCHDKAYNIEQGLLFSMQKQRFIRGWFADKKTFMQVDPSHDCNHHCLVDGKNSMILEYLDVDQEHSVFV